MHKLAITFSLITFLSFILMLPGKAQVNLTNGLVAYYPFSGNANDASGNGNNAVFNNATLTADRFGNPNSAYLFDGVSSYIQVPNSPSLNTNGQISLCVYVKPMGFYYGPCHGNSVIEKTGAFRVTGDYFLRFDDGPYTLGLNCANANVDTIHQAFYASTGVDAPADFIQKDQWYCLVETYDGTYARMYLDGVITDSLLSPGITWNNSFDLYFGRLNSGLFPYWFNGALDEIRIYNRALNQAEVAALCGGCTTVPASTVSFAAGAAVDSIAACEGTDTVAYGYVPNGYTNPVYTWQVSSDSGASWVDIPNSNQLQITLAPAPAGSTITYQYHLVVTDPTNITQPGCPAVSNLLYFTSVVAPLPDFSFDEDVCNPLQVDFASTAPAGASYDWLIGGTPYTGQNPTVLFGQYGSYPVKLKITENGGCSDSIQKTISVLVQPGKIITTPDATICSGKGLRLETLGVAGFCWSPVAYLDNPFVGDPVAMPPVMTKYYFTAKTVTGNLVPNGNFSMGNTGFHSSYTYSPVNNSEGEYFVSTSPHNWNPNAPISCGDHTTGNGNMMMINGSLDPAVNVWTQQVTVTPNTNYSLSAWIQSMSPQHLVVLQFSVNGIPLGKSFNAAAGTCYWQPYVTTWNSGSNTSVTLGLINVNATQTISIFAIDDIYFAPVTLQMDSVTVSVETPSMTAGSDTIVCRGAPVRLHAAGTASYSWSPGHGLSDSTISNPIATPGVSTAYVVTGFSADGCIGKDTVTVAIYPYTTAILTPDTIVCLGDPVQIQAIGGSAYTWSPAQYLDDPGVPDPIARPLSSIRYFLTGTDANHCTEIDSVTLSVRPAPVFSAPPGNLSLCEGNSVVLGKNDPLKYVYDWSPAISLDDPSFPTPMASPVSTTLYTVRISDSVCISYDSIFSVSVNVKPSPAVVAQKANDIDCSIATSRLSATGATSYDWSPAQGLSDPHISNPTASIDSTTTFIVRGTDRNGCFAFDTVMVKVTATGKNLFVVPNAFSPNGDGHNDCFGISRWGDVTIEEFSVYNRWGTRIFTTRNPSECWDGNFRGKPQETGAYPYVIKARSFCGEITRTGVVMLVR